MTIPPVPRRTGGAAIAALVLGVASFLGALLFGIRWSGVELLTYATLPLLLGGVAVIVGIVALATAHRRGGGGFGAALTGLILGPLALVALFVGRYLGEEHLGFPYPG